MLYAFDYCLGYSRNYAYHEIAIIAIFFAIIAIYSKSGGLAAGAERL